MFNGLFLQTFGFYGGTFGDFLSALDQAGAFSYIIPFLLIFAIVFGIMTRMNIFGQNKSINSVIALSVSLLSLQFDFVPLFFSEIFPRVGVALSVILVLFILVGMFLPSQGSNHFNWLLFVIAGAIFIIVLMKTFGSLGYQSGLWYFIQPYLPLIIVVGGVIALIGTIIRGGAPPQIPQLNNPYWQHPRGP